MASLQDIAAEKLTAQVPSSRQVRYEGRAMNIEALKRAEKETEEAELAVEEGHQLAMKLLLEAEDEAATKLRHQAASARKLALAKQAADLTALLQAERQRAAENTAAAANLARSQLED